MKNHHFRYLISFGLGGVVPAVILFLLLPLEERVLLAAVTLYVVLFTAIWDVASSKGPKTVRSWIWDFNPQSIVGIHIFGLPIEEFIFMIVTPVFVISFWEFVSGLELSNSILLGVAALLLLFAACVFPILKKPDTRDS